MLHKIKKILLYFILFYTLFGFIVLPFIAKPQIIQAVSQNTNAKLSIKSIYFNPFLFKIKLSGVQLSSLENKELVSFDSLFVDLELYSLMYGAVHIKNLTLQHPKISLVLDKKKQFNLQKIVKSKKDGVVQEGKKETKIPRVILDNITMKEGVVAYKDFTRKTPFSFTLERMGIKLKNIDTKNLKTNPGYFRFYSTLGDGGFVDFKSKIHGLQPFEADGSLDFEASKLYTEWRYMRDMLNLEVADGKISFHAKYKLNTAAAEKTVVDDLNVSLSALRIKPKNKPKDILNLNSLRVSGGVIYPLLQKGSVEKIALDGLKVKATRRADGVIDWIEYVKVQNTQSKNTKSKQTNTQKKKWDFLIKDIALEDIDATFYDKNIHPNVKSAVEDFNLTMQNVTLAGIEPLYYKGEMGINSKGQCSFSGDLIHNVLDIHSNTKCENLDIVHYKPYIDTAAKNALKVYDVDLQSLMANLSAKTHLQDKNGSILAVVEDANVSLENFRVKKKSTKEKLGSFRSFSVKNVVIESGKKEVDIEKVTLEKALINLQRYKNKKLNIENIVVAKKAKKQKEKKAKGENPYNVLLHEFALKDAKVTLTDRALPKAQYHKIDRIYSNFYDISTKKGSWLRYKTSLRVNSKGSVQLKGKLRHTPLKQKGYFTIKNIALRDISPYLQERMNIDINDGRLLLSGYEQYAKSKRNPDLKVRGKFRLDSLFINNTQDDSLLFSLNELNMKTFTLELSPNRLYIDDVLINAFYVDAAIDENKTLNFSKLMKNEEKKSQKTPKHAEEKEQKKKEPFPVKIAKIDVKNGSAKFKDFSLPIKFKTHIHDLNGVLYSVTNQPKETTYVKISGEVDKYGSTLLKGSIDSSDPKAFTDLDFNFKNLDLSAMSGYSAEFAGYKIDDGKLFLDLGYEVMNSKLHGSNSIIIKKIKLGDEIEDENVTHLPLGFVIALLEDSDGIIDIDMPVEGNLNQPDFKYGALVLKTLGNLIAKAVTSPFKFLGSMLGIDADDLEYVEFEAARFAITPPQREKLDKLAKVMLKRPKIALRVLGTYDEVKDTYALKRDKLLAEVLKRSKDKNIKESESTMSIELLEEVYAQKHAKELSALQERLHKEYKDDESSFQRAYRKELINRSIEMQKVDKSELEILAKARMKAVKNYLILEKQIDKKRLSDGKISSYSANKSGLIETKLEIEVVAK